MSDLPSLESLLSDVSATLPTATDEHRLITRADLPTLPDALGARRIVVRKVFRTSNDHRVDRVVMFVERRTARLLGLAMLSQLLHQGPAEVRVHLSHPESEMRTLLLDAACTPYVGFCGLRIAACAFEYWPEETTSLPGRRCNTPDDFPVAYWTCDPCGPNTWDEWLRCDILRVGGRASAFAWLAKILLDIGNPLSREVRATLEGDAVAEGSAEIDIQLPGGGPWVDDLFLEPTDVETS